MFGKAKQVGEMRVGGVGEWSKRMKGKFGTRTRGCRGSNKYGKVMGEGSKV